MKRFKIRCASSKGDSLSTFIVYAYCSYDARVSFRLQYPGSYISSVKLDT
jgi:hypothetical protein